MQLFRFSEDSVILYEGEELTGIYLVRAGSVNLKVRSSLFEEYNLQRLYPGCSYGAYSFFADEESLARKSKFTMAADTMGEYFYIPYSGLDLLGLHDAQMNEIIVRNKHFIREHGGVPWCDFKASRRNSALYLRWMQAIRRLIILNKQRRSDILHLKKEIEKSSIEKKEEACWEA